MKNIRGWALIITLLSGIGGAIYNGTGEPIVSANGEEFELEKIELAKNLKSEYKKRGLTDSLWIDIHCSDTKKKYDVKNIANWHVHGNNWPGIGYAALIEYDGDIYLANDLETISYHNAGENTQSIGICIIGDYDEYEIDDEAMNSLKILLDALCTTFKIKGIRGHSDNKNTYKTCPGTIGYAQLEREGVFFNNK